jgi:hypothetical protein
MKRRNALVIASFVLVAVPVSVILAAWSTDFGHRYHFWSTPGEILERRFVSHDGLNSFGTSIGVLGVNSPCWFAILCMIFVTFSKFRRRFVIVLLLSWVTEVSWGQYRNFQRNKEISGYIDARPSTQNLSLAQTRTLEEAPVLSHIAGYIPKCKGEGSAPGFPYVEPIPHAGRWVSNGTATSDTCASPQPVSATVIQYPNATWAQYEARINPATGDPRAAKIETKFGNTIVVTTKTLDYLGYVDFYWVSGDTVVRLRFQRSARDPFLQGEFVKAYLDKYPTTS